MDLPTHRVRTTYNRLAGAYDLGDRAQRLVLGNARDRLSAHARGKVLVVAVGTGHDLRHLPAGTEVTGVDLSPSMLARAQRRADAIGLPVSLVEGDAQALPFPDGTFDTVICSLALCTIPDQARALREMHRVLRPGGQVLLMDHVEYTRRPMRLVEARRKRPRRLPRAVAEEVGFAVEQNWRVAGGFVDLVVGRRPTGAESAPPA